MLTHSPAITLSFAVDAPTACGTIHAQPPLTEEQRLKAIESYALIAASHPVSVKKLVDESETVRPSNKLQSNKPPSPKVPQGHRNQSSLGLSLRLQDTFRNYVRLRVPNQISHPPRSERHRPSRELRMMFASHDKSTQHRDELRKMPDRREQDQYLQRLRDQQRGDQFQPQHLRQHQHQHQHRHQHQHHQHFEHPAIPQLRTAAQPRASNRQME